MLSGPDVLIVLVIALFVFGPPRNFQSWPSLSARQ